MGADVLVIGGEGLVGTHVVAALAGRHIVVSTRSATATSRALDVSDGTAVRGLISEVRPGVVVLAAADANVDHCETDPIGSAAVNVGATEAAAEAADDVGARLIVYSSEYVFPGGGGRYREEDRPGPINEYGRQKVVVERIASRVPGYLVLRTSGVFGWEPACKNFVCRVVRTLGSARAVRVPDDQVITPTYAPDLARATVDLIDSSTSGVVHVAGPETVERLWFGRAVARAFGLDERLIRASPSADMGYRAQRPLRCGLDDARLRNLLGHRLRGPEDALADMRLSEPAGR